MILYQLFVKGIIPETVCSISKPFSVKSLTYFVYNSTPGVSDG